MFSTKCARWFLNIFFALSFCWQGLISPAKLGMLEAGMHWQDEEQKAEILSPEGGSALQGVVVITGTTDIDGFRSAEIAFAYQTDPTRTWFTIQQLTQPVKESTLASWDTTTITDGDYRLRLQIILDGGGVQEVIVEGLRVRNYTRVETSTPDASTRIVTPTLTASPLPDFQVTPRSRTPFPTNPAEVSAYDLRKSFLGGALGVMAALAFGLLYIGARKVLRG